MPNGRPTFIDLRGEKYFDSQAELDSFKKFMQMFNMMNENGELFNAEESRAKLDDVVEVFVNDTNVNNPIFYRVVDGKNTNVPIAGEFDKLYIAINKDVDSQYRWNGSKFVSINRVSKAISAENDSDGKSIKDTYATRSELQVQATDIENLETQVGEIDEISEDAINNMFSSMFD